MSYQHWLLLSLWIVLGACFRFFHLGELPPWTDESATLVFSLGNTFYDVPLDKFIGLTTLLEPLQANPEAGIGDVIHHLMSESTHPPVYFALTHWWLKIFSPDTGLVSLWAARSLSALLGVISIPAIFYFSWFAFPSPIVAQIAAALMAVSPFGIFLARQARHYTLIILIIIASLYCFIRAFRSISRQEIIPLWLVFIWIAIDCLGIATHYFFVLTLAAMAIAFLPPIWQQFRQDKTGLGNLQWRRIYAVAFGSVVGCLIWLPVLQSIQDSPPTDWIYQSDLVANWLNPIGRSLLWLMSMTIMLPSSIYDFPVAVVIVFGLLTLLFWILLLPRLSYGLKLQQQDSYGGETISALKGYLIAEILIFCFFTYFLGMDLTLAARFHFVYFPALIVVIAASLGGLWQRLNKSVTIKPKSSKYSWLNSTNYYGKRIVVIFILAGFCGGAISVLNLGYLQNHRPDLMIDTISEASEAPVTIATTYKHHGQTGRMIALAWELKDLPNISSPQFFLATKDLDTENYDRSVQKLEQQLSQIKRPLDLWLINFRAKIDLKTQNCLPDLKYRGRSGEYHYKLYRCQN